MDRSITPYFAATEKPTEIPALACRLANANVKFAHASSDGVVVPVSILARSGEPINHWYWGKIVHDLSGMSHKDTVPIDYCHDDYEILGFLNEFDIDHAGLLCTGSIVLAVDPNDRGREVLHKAQHGVPYEASIYFDQDHGLVLEDIPEGYQTEVNGRTFEGPGVVVRQWMLRGVAICPYGYDMNTASQFRRAGDRTVRVSFLTADEDQPTMAITKKPTKLTDEKPADEQDSKPADAQAAADTPAAESAPAKTDDTDATATSTEDQPATLSITDARRYRDAFGAKGLEWLVDGKTYEECVQLHAADQAGKLEALETENKKLRDQLAASKAAGGETDPASFADGNEGSPKRTIRSAFRPRNNVPSKN